MSRSSPSSTFEPGRVSGRRDVARAIDACRRGWPVRITGADGAIVVLPIESADDARLAAFDQHAQADILISETRAVTLKLANQIEAATPGPVRVARQSWIDLPGAVAIADPALDLATPLKGPYRAIPPKPHQPHAAALTLARLAGLLPAFFVAEHAGDIAVVVGAADILSFEQPLNLAIASRARLPVAAAEQAEIVAFRSAEDAVEHVALVIGAPDGQPPLVRLHSECLTGDALGSLKCDCGPQLDAALHAIAASGWGVLLYLRQEGRGIGLVNKLRAYALQDQGFDTVDANLRLGFGIDERDFGVAARMLSLLGQDRVRLMTNNPSKVAGLEAQGIAVAERVPHRMGDNPHNHLYLATKRDRTGHAI
ncbi:GTP cyclohydrolase II [Sphingomonas sp. ID0503]|uniref:GTP cyclohydrolase II n=1 Tax=Sphingomonas sp. ID0503 TaxID=3399691 RepID=UPI003AFA8B23